MHKLLILCLSLLVNVAFAIELKGELTQGSLIRGTLPKGSTLWLNDRAIEISPQGHFAFAFSRDAALNHEVKWKSPNDTSMQTQDINLTSREYKVQRIEGLPAKMVTPPKSVTKRIQKDNREVKKARELRDVRTDFMQNFIWPAAGPISGVYGSQRVLNGVPKRPHFGVDVAAPTGTPVYAPADGVVTLFVPDMYYSGGTLIIDHGMGVSSTFLHLSNGHVTAGTKVEQGQLIAEIGATGRVTGAHLDWRMNWHEVRFDPQLLVPKR